MSGTTVVDAARQLAPELSERAGEGEQQRTMPTDLVDKLSHADGSAGWTTLSNATPCARGDLNPHALAGTGT